MHAPGPVQASQCASQAPQAVSCELLHAAVVYIAAGQLEQVAHAALPVAEQAAVWYWPAEQVWHAAHTVSLVAPQAAVW